MPIEVRWDAETGRQIIHFKQAGVWTWDEYDAAVAESVRLMESVKNPVTLIIDLLDAKTNAKSSMAFRHFMDALKCWQAAANYAHFWLVLKPTYWEQISLWIVAQLYNPYDMVVATSLEDARSKALMRLNPESSSEPRTDNIQDTA